MQILLKSWGVQSRTGSTKFAAAASLGLRAKLDAMNRTAASALPELEGSWERAEAQAT